MVVDSKERELSVEEILDAAAEETESPYSKQQVKDYFLKEVMSPNTKTYRYGNTLYVVHPGQTRKDSGSFRALNADTADNYLQSGYRFVDDAYNAGFRKLATQFKDQSIINIFRSVSKNPPRPGMGYSVNTTRDGGYLVGLNLGKDQQGEVQ
jgi:hypothetical protein